jgi:hypothetical protein
LTPLSMSNGAPDLRKPGLTRSAVTDQPPPDDASISGTEEEQAADDEKVLVALASHSPQTFEELAMNTSIEPAWVGLAVGRLQRSGRVRLRVQDGTEYVLLK